MAPPDDSRHWPVLAWIRLRLPAAPPLRQLMPGPAPRPMPPLDLLQPEAVATDPTVRLFSHAETLGEGVVRLVWQASQPETLLAEYRAPRLIGRLPPEEVREFWNAVKRRTAELGPLPVLGADPRG